MNDATDATTAAPGSAGPIVVAGDIAIDWLASSRESERRHAQLASAGWHEYGRAAGRGYVACADADA